MQSPQNGPESGGDFPPPEELVQNMDYGQLGRLSDSHGGLKGRWLTVVRDERKSREQTLDGMRQYEPPNFDAPPYVGSEEYLTAARKVNTQSLLRSGNDKAQLAVARNIASLYVAAPENNARIMDSTSRSVDTAGLGKFFGANLYGLIGTAHAVALGLFELKRNDAIRAHIPDIKLADKPSMLWSIMGRPITASRIEAARRDVAALPPTRAPYPDFFQLSDGQQLEIVGAIADEWEELCRILHGTDPKLFRAQRTLAAKPLAVQPVSTLRSAIRDNPDIPATRICQAFLRMPNRFSEEVAKLATRATIEIQLAALAAKSTVESDTDPASSVASTTQLTADVIAERHEHVFEFIEYDHALVTVGSRNFYLPTDQPKSLLAARVLRALAQHEETSEFDGAILARDIWSEMPVAERQLFTTRQKELARASGVIDEEVYDILRRLTNIMGITRETSGERFRIEARPDVNLSAAPPAEGLAGLTPIFPPNTSREKIAEFTGDVIPAEYLAAAAEVLREHAAGGEPLSQSDALELLGFIMARNGKRALRAQLDEAGNTSGIESILHDLHSKIRGSLGEAYTSAYQNRVIAGNHATGQHKIKHVSGDLPVITRSPTTFTRRWYVGGSRF